MPSHQRGFEHFYWGDAAAYEGGHLGKEQVDRFMSSACSTSPSYAEDCKTKKPLIPSK